MIGRQAGQVPFPRDGVSQDLDTEYGLDWYAGWYCCQYDLASRVGGDAERVYLTSRVFAHSCKFYEKGWDVIMETMEPHEVAAHVRTGQTVDEAIRSVAANEHLKAYVDRRNDALAAGGLETDEFELGVDDE